MAALKLMRKILKQHAFAPERLVTDDLRSCSAAAQDLGIERRHERGRWKSNRALEFASADAAAGTQDAAVQEPGVSPEISFHTCRRLQQHLNAQRHLVCAPTDRVLRAEALATWRTAAAAA